MTIIQIVLSAFLVFALSRVILRYKDGQIRLSEFFFWSLLFMVATLAVIFPSESSHFAAILGIGRGADLIIYASVAVLFYLVFRLYVLLENIRHEITEIVRLIALKETK